MKYSICKHGSSPLNYMGDLKISDQNNWGDLSKKLNLGGRLNLRRDLKFRGGLQDFISRKLAEANLLLNIKKNVLLCLPAKIVKIVFLSACLSCLPVCQSNFNGWFRSQGKYRATLEFKSSRCAVSNNLNYDSSLSLSVSVKVIPKFLIQPSVIASKQCVRG